MFNQDEFRRLVDFIPVPMMVAEYIKDSPNSPSTYVMRHLNQAFQQLIGYSIEDIPTITEWFELAFPDPEYRDIVWQEWFSQVRQSVRESAATASIMAKITCKNGQQRWFEVTSDVSSSIKPGHSIVMYVDIDQHKQVQAHLEMLAQTDELTHLSNRRRMIIDLVHEMKRARRSGLPFTLVLADIDDFKDVNDTFGHECGDELLQYLAATLRAELRTTDMLARWGGEEFCLLLPETDSAGAEMLLERVRQALREQPFFYHDHVLPLTLTFGLTMYDQDDDINATLRKADLALYYGKRHGKNTLISYADHMKALLNDAL